MSTNLLYKKAPIISIHKEFLDSVENKLLKKEISEDDLLCVQRSAIYQERVASYVKILFLFVGVSLEEGQIIYVAKETSNLKEEKILIKSKYLPEALGVVNKRLNRYNKEEDSIGKFDTNVGTTFFKEEEFYNNLRLIIKDQKEFEESRLDKATRSGFQKEDDFIRGLSPHPQVNRSRTARSVKEWKRIFSLIMNQDIDFDYARLHEEIRASLLYSLPPSHLPEEIRTRFNEKEKEELLYSSQKALIEYDLYYNFFQKETNKFYYDLCGYKLTKLIKKEMIDILAKQATSKMQEGNNSILADIKMMDYHAMAVPHQTKELLCTYGAKKIKEKGDKSFKHFWKTYSKQSDKSFQYLQKILKSYNFQQPLTEVLLQEEIERILFYAAVDSPSRASYPKATLKYTEKILKARLLTIRIERSAKIKNNSIS